MFDGLTSTNFLLPENFVILSSIFFLVVFLRYLTVSGIFHILFYKLLFNQFAHRIVNGPIKSRRQISKEISWSAITSFVFAISGTFMVIQWQREDTMIYVDVMDYPIWYLPLSLLVILFLHETYYYWLHRWMHLPKVFKLMHKVHHDSITTTSLTSFSFHPLEAIAQALIIPLIVFFIPVNIYVLLIILVLMTLSGTINHAGVELYSNNWFGKWVIGASHHDLHHKRFRVNFGLYFTFWDRWMGTESVGFEVKVGERNK